jgi:glutathione S-transferase
VYKKALRMLLRYSGQEYNDVVSPFADWMERKASMPLNDAGAQTLPVYGWEAELLPESAAIAAKISRDAGSPLWPADAEAQHAAATFWAYNDSHVAPWCHPDGIIRLGMINPLLNWFSEADAQPMITRYFTGVPTVLQLLSRDLGDGLFFGGKAPWYGEFVVFHCLDNIQTLDGGTALASSDASDALRAWMAAMAALPGVEEYLAERPQPGSQEVGREGSIIWNHAVPARRGALLS